MMYLKWMGAMEKYARNVKIHHSSLANLSTKKYNKNLKYKIALKLSGCMVCS